MNIQEENSEFNFNGALDICIVKNPLEGWDSSSDRNIRLQLFYEEWASFFYDSIGVPKPQTYSSGELYHDYAKRQEELFSTDLSWKGFPLLSRICDIYQDATFLSEEVAVLRDECVRAEKVAQEELASNFIKKLMYGCDLAIKSESGLVLISD